MNSSAAENHGPPLVVDPDEIQRLLLIQLGAIGDVILATPAIRAARARFSSARIDFLTRPTGADVLNGNPYLDEVLVYPERTRLPLPLLRAWRRRRYDAVVDFHSVPRSAIVAGFTGAPHRIGMRGRGPRNWLYTHLLPKKPPPHGYEARRKLELLGPLGVTLEAATSLELHIEVQAADREWAAAVRERLGLQEGRPVVAISPVFREWFKNWGPERWAQVADTLMDGGCQVLLTHGPGEREQVAAVVEHMRRQPAWDIRPGTIRQMAALYERCSLWVGNDGGPKHMAAAMGIPTVAVFRWRQGTQWTDDRPHSGHVYLEQAPPQGCDLQCARCPHLGCLRAVTVDEVLAAALQALATAPREARSHVRSQPLIDHA